MLGMTHYILVYLGRDMENSATKLEKFGKNRRKFDSGVGDLGGHQELKEAYIVYFASKYSSEFELI